MDSSDNLVFSLLWVTFVMKGTVLSDCPEAEIRHSYVSRDAVVWQELDDQTGTGRL